MKLKKTLACVAAASVAVSALAVNAFAVAVTDNVKVNGSAGTDTFVLDLAAEGVLDGVDIADVYGFSMKLSEETMAAAAETGIGGGIIYNHAAGWDQLAWGDANAKAEKPNDVQFVISDDGVVARLDEAPVLTAEDVSGEENTWGQIVLSFWWGPEEVAVDQVSLLGADGSALKTFPGEVAVGNTDFSGGTPTAIVAVEPGDGLVNDSGMMRVNIVHPWADPKINLFGDSIADLSNAVAIGVHFEVTEYAEYGKPFTVDINASEAGGQQYWGEGNTANAGVTTAPVTVDADGDYIAWIMFDAPVSIDENFFLDLATDIAAPEAANLAADDGLPQITLLEVGVQDGTPAPGGTTPPDDTSKDDNNNVNTGVTLAVVPAALAAAALVGAAVATKKRK